MLQRRSARPGPHALEPLLKPTRRRVLARGEIPNRAAFRGAKEFEPCHGFFVAEMELPPRAKRFGNRRLVLVSLKAEQAQVGQDQQSGLVVQTFIEVQLEPSHGMFTDPKRRLDQIPPCLGQGICLS